MVLGAAGERAALRRGHAWTTAITAATTFVALGGTSLTRTGARMADLLSSDDVSAGRRLLPSLCGRDPAALDADGLARAAVESVAENTSDAHVAPLLWAVVGGVPAMLVYRGANTLDAMIGHRSPRYQRFGWAAARFDDIVNFAAARVTGVLVAVCAPAVGGSPAGVVRAWRRDAARHPAPMPGSSKRRSRVRWESVSADPLNTPTSWRSGHHLVTGRRPDSDLVRAVRLSRAVQLLSTALAVAVSGACRCRGRRSSLRW